MTTKECTKCGEVKPLSEYHKQASRKDGIKTQCKICLLVKAKRYREENKPEIAERNKTWREANKEKIAARNRAYHKANKKKIIARATKWNKENKEKRYKTCKKYYDANKNKIWAHERKRRIKDPEFRILKNLRGRLRLALNGSRKTDTTKKLVGCNTSELRRHLESQFTEGMSWDNYGYNGWHIDHIIPCASFDLSDPEQQRRCFHYTNLQPLWAEDNLRKSDKIL